MPDIKVSEQQHFIIIQLQSIENVVSAALHSETTQSEICFRGSRYKQSQWMQALLPAAVIHVRMHVNMLKRFQLDQDI